LRQPWKNEQQILCKDDNKKSKTGPTRKQKRELAGGGCCDRLGCGLWRNEGNAFHYVEAGAAEKLVDNRLGEARCVVLYADGLVGFVEHNTADAVDLADAAQRHGCVFGGRGEVAVHYVKLRHRVILSAAIWSQADSFFRKFTISGLVQFSGPMNLRRIMPDLSMTYVSGGRKVLNLALAPSGPSRMLKSST